MAETLALVCPAEPSERLNRVLNAALRGCPHERISWLTDPLCNRRLLFALPISAGGPGHSFYDLLAFLRTHPGCLSGSVGGVIADGTGDLYTKSAARELVLAASLAGCAFPGRPLVEATGSLRNFTVQAKNANCSLPEAYRLAVEDLAQRVLSFSPPRRQRPKLLVLHASSRATSNTLALWEMVRRSLPPEVQVQEICLRNGTMADCNGCSYTACMHFGERGGCFYGGPMVEEVYPAVRSCDTLVMVCANYNDALSANLTACVNRLTALFRQTRFYEKRLYGLVVSGYSGGDLLARQLISALNMNKAFYLPPRFCLLETANERGSLVRLPGIREKARCFARQMME